MADADDAGPRCKPLDSTGERFRSPRGAGNVQARIQQDPISPRNLRIGDPSMPGRLWDDNAFTHTLQAVADKLAALPQGSSPSAGPVRQSSTQSLAKPDPTSHTQRVRQGPPDDIFLFGPLDLLADTFTSVRFEQAMLHSKVACAENGP